MILETERLILREFGESDLESVQEYASDPEVVRYMVWGPNTLEHSRIYIQSRLAHINSQPRLVYNFALVLKENGKLIGACELHITQPESKEAALGYVLNRVYWNRGYTTEAVNRIQQFGFRELGLHRVYSHCDPSNIGSYRVMEKTGMKYEGRIREHKFTKGKWRDSLQYSILEQELH